MITYNHSAANLIQNGEAQDLKISSDKIRQCTTPLPGSIPYENWRPIRVSKPFDCWEVLPFLKARFPQVIPTQWETVIEKGNLMRNNHSVSPKTTVRAGNILFHRIPQTTEPSVSNKIKILYEDEALLVIDKPAPLPMHPSGRFNKNTLISFIDIAYPNLKPRIVHRLDRDTTGVVILTKSKENASNLRRQFDENSVKKSYIAHVNGVPKHRFFTLFTIPQPKIPKRRITGPSEKWKNGTHKF